MSEPDREWSAPGSDHLETEPEEPRWTLRMIAVRSAAAALFVSFLSSLYVTFRGVEHIFAVVGLIVLAALVGMLAKRQRDAENPYRSDDYPDIRPR